MENRLRSVLVLGLAFILLSALFLAFLLQRFPYSQVKHQNGAVQMEYMKNCSLLLTGLESTDRVMINFQTRVPLNLTVWKGSRLIPTAPFEVEGRTQVFVDYLVDTQRFLFIAPKDGDYALSVTPMISKTPYGLFLSNETCVSISQSIVNGHAMLNVTLSSLEPRERFPKIFLAYPLDLVVRNDFEISGVACLADGAIGLMTINLVDDTDYAMYGYMVLSSTTEKGQMIPFHLDSTSRDLFGHGTIKSDKISFISVGIALDKLHPILEGQDTIYASILIGDIHVLNDGKEETIEAKASSVFEAPYEVYISSKLHIDNSSYLLYALLMAGVTMIGVAIFSGERKNHGSMGYVS